MQVAPLPLPKKFQNIFQSIQKCPTIDIYFMGSVKRAYATRITWNQS